MVARCWRARISVGAMIGGLPPGLDRAGHGEERDDGLAGADIALQEPQHARRRRAMSARISSSAPVWLRVSEKGRAASIRFAIRPSPVVLRPPSRFICARTIRRASCEARSSS